jgi:hypothetical protein
LAKIWFIVPQFCLAVSVPRRQVIFLTTIVVLVFLGIPRLLGYNFQICRIVSAPCKIQETPFYSGDISSVHNFMQVISHNGRDAITSADVYLASGMAFTFCTAFIENLLDENLQVYKSKQRSPKYRPGRL